MDSVGKSIHQTKTYQFTFIFNTVYQIIRWTVFSIVWSVFLFSGCARQQLIIKTPEIKRKVPLIRVALDDNLTQGSLAFKNKYILKCEEADYILDEMVGEFLVNFSGHTLSFKSSQRYFSFSNFDKIEFTPLSNSVFTWNDIPFHGTLIFVKDENQIYVINSLSLPEYLKGVVPYEIPCSSEEYYQAIVSQAIAARTYATYHLSHPSSQHFDVYADTRDQIYSGMKNQAPLANKAIAESAGIILQNKKGQPLEAQYHSTCGGILDLKLNIEGNLSTSYLEDLYDDQFNCMTSPLYRWVEKISTKEILKNLVTLGKISKNQANSWRERGFNVQIHIQSRSKSGRVEKILMKINDESIFLYQWEIRHAFRTKTGKPLPSTLFFLKKSLHYPDTLYLIGAGFGHGKGMCQWGAIGLALKQKSAKEILQFYYPGNELKKVY